MTEVAVAGRSLITTEHQPIHSRADLKRVLEHVDPERPISSAQLAEGNFFFLQEIAHDREVTLADLAKLQSAYPQALLNGRPEDPETLASVLAYVGDRVPTKVFRPGVQLRIHNKTAKTMQVPHVFEAASTRYRKKAPARSRWTIIDSSDPQHPVVDFQLRDSVPSEPTDGLELLSWLGSLEQVRQTTAKLLLRGVDCSSVKNALGKVLRSHILAEVEMLNKRLAIEIFTRKSGGVADGGLIDRLTDRITTLEGRLQDKRFAQDLNTLFYDWINRDGSTVSLKQEYTGDLQLLADTSVQESAAARQTTTLIAKELERQHIDPITDVFYGNDFTLRIFLSLGLFTTAEWSLLEKYFQAKYAVVAANIESLPDGDMREAAKKFFLVQQLSLYTGNIGVFVDLKQRLFAPETFEQIGITRLVQTKDSPTADPIDVIVPARICPEVKARLPKAILELVEKIAANNQVILSTAYPLGHLTAMLSEALRQQFPSIQTYAFAGKVGLYSEGREYDRVGELMFPTTVSNQFGDEVLPVINQLSAADIREGSHGVRSGHNFTTMALTAQSHLEMTQEAGLTADAQALSLDVELYPFMQWYHHLPEAVQHTIATLMGYYFSDKSIPPDKFNLALHGGDKISERLGLRGSIPVFLSFYALLSRMAETNTPTLAAHQAQP